MNNSDLRAHLADLQAQMDAMWGNNEKMLDFIEARNASDIYDALTLSSMRDTLDTFVDQHEPEAKQRYNALSNAQPLAEYWELIRGRRAFYKVGIPTLVALVPAVVGFWGAAQELTQGTSNKWQISFAVGVCSSMIVLAGLFVLLSNRSHLKSVRQRIKDFPARVRKAQSELQQDVDDMGAYREMIRLIDTKLEPSPHREVVQRAVAKANSRPAP
ncbi:MAG TPA: hypothetical protein VHB73_01825 [Alphaproteobacteria bacterium]|nr:hypothetical protein [Alphaproteobacteria bacterium]